MVLLEAMARGVPVVSTAVGGIPDLLSSNEARLVDAGDPAGIAAAVEELLGNPTLSRKLGESARARLERDLTVDAWVDRHIQIYRAIMRG